MNIPSESQFHFSFTPIDQVLLCGSLLPMVENADSIIWTLRADGE